PTNRFSPLSTSLLKYLPAPTTGGFTNNYAPNTGIIPNRQTNWGFTIDHNINEKQALHYAEWRDNYSNIAQTNNYFPNGSVLAGSKFQPSLGTGFFLTYSNTITPNLVMTAGMSWAGEINNQFSLQKNYSFPGVVGSVQLPTIYFDGPLSPTTWGTDTGWTQSINRKLGISIANNWLWVHGKHTLNFGVELRRAYQDDNECQQCAGSFRFSNFTTANPNDLSSTGNSFASFLLGQADSAIRQQANELRLRNLSVSPYLQDDIKLTSRFTLNVGLRWDIMRPFTEVNNQVVFFDPNIPNPGAAGRLGAASKLGICDGCANYERAWIQWSHFSPRLGFTYQLNQKTVVQSGFSMNYLNGGAFEFGTNKVAVSYGNLLQGVFQRVSNNSNIPGYGSWDAQAMPFPTPAPFSPSLGNGATIHAFNRNADTAPYITTWNAGIQRELPWNLFFTGTYVGNKVNHLPSALNPFDQLNPAYLAQYGSLLGQPVTSVPGAPIPYPGFLNDFPGASLQQALRPYP
ncbi:MAG TPA: TonB-dependent receptor, partial [Bryobacteraceae bacterium]